METITFYSYKGGVGRTLALSNIAIYLSRFGQNVCIMDFDLEAPGLHYKFPQSIKTADITSGLIDYIYEFTHNNAIPESLDGFAPELIPQSNSRGWIRLIPAGDIHSPDYWRKLASIDWHSLFYEEGGEGIPFFLELKERIRKEFNPDFLLIDSRTGITEMGGLCTSLLPDKVVFLIVNNQENIEGARQILRSIQTVERFPGQKPIEVTFALTRIPFLEEGDGEGIERRIVKNIQDFLNEPVEDLASQLNIQDICILHSDRELELSESLRMSQEGITREAPLLQDYLRLFSKIIPDEVIIPKLDSIFEEIAATRSLLEDPDKAQHELEGLAASYAHPKSFEMLINFYILRNAGRDKVLGAFHNLWETFGIEDPETLSRYVSFFMKWDLHGWSKPVFELSIVEKYLEFDPADRIAVEERLADAYKGYDRPEIALKHYLEILDKVKDKIKILGEVLNIYIWKELYGDAVELSKKYSDIIDETISLRLKKVKVMFKLDEVEEMQKLLDDGGVTERNLVKEDPKLYSDAMERLGRSEEVDDMLDMLLNETLKTGSRKRLYEVGVIFYKLGKWNEFGRKISGKHPEANEIHNELHHRMLG